jgi:hypothetical protein
VLHALGRAIVQSIILLKSRVDILVVLLGGLDDLLRDALEGEAVAVCGGSGVDGLLGERQWVHVDGCVCVCV